MSMIHPKQMKSLTLAYLGDAVYELHVRSYLIESGITNPQTLHEQAITFVSGKAQADIMNYFLEEKILNETETTMFKRGRNASSHSAPRNVSAQTYRYGTGFETLIGYLYLEKQQERLDAL